MNEFRSAPVSMSRNPYSMSNIQSEPHTTFTTPMAQEEMEDIGELVSSRPVALSQLYTKANSRTKSGRATKAFIAQMASESKPDALPLAQDFRETGQGRYGIQFPPMHPVSAEEYALDPYRNDAKSSRITSQERVRDPAEIISEQVWQRMREGHQQQNPLSYSDDVGAYCLSRPQERSCVSESPFLKNNGYRKTEQDAWATEANPIPGRSSLDAGPPKSISRNLLSQSENIPQSSLHLYRASFDRPEDQSPYGSLRLHHSLYESSGAYEAPSVEKPPQERYKDYTTIRSGTMLTGVPAGEPVSRTYDYSPELQSQMSSARAQPSTRALASIASGTGLSESSALKSSMKRQTNEEVTRLLDKIAQDRTSHIKQTALPDPFVEPKASSGHRASGSQYRSEELALLAAKLGEYASLSHGRSSTDHRTHSEPTELRSLCESTITEVPSLKKNSALGYSNAGLNENYGQVHAGPQAKATVKILRPPPGLPIPAVNRMMAEELFGMANYDLVKARFEEANAWFHKDPRGEEPLRQYVAAIAQSHAEKFERLTGNDGTNAKQMNLLLGNVIVNLYTHFSESNQSQATNLEALEGGDTSESAPSFARRRSYFDRDPSVSCWRFPLGRASSEVSRYSDKTAGLLS